jgi:hypothetical protein
VLTKDAFAPILLSCPVLILWTLIDFQNYRDLFVLLPYLAIGFGKFLDLAVHGMGRSEGATLRGGTQKFLTVGLCVSLVALAVTNPTADAKMDDLRAKFDQQRQAATEIENRFGSDVRLVSINAPQVLVLQHRTNPTRYGFILRGIDPYIHATTPGGFEGWIRELEAYNPDVVVLGNPRGPHVEKELMDWLNSNYHREAIGPFTLYVRNSIDE